MAMKSAQNQCAKQAIVVHSIQKERGYTSAFLTSNKFKKELFGQRIKTDNAYQRYIKTIAKFRNDKFKLNYEIQDIQNNYYNLINKRNDIDVKNIGVFIDK